MLHHYHTPTPFDGPPPPPTQHELYRAAQFDSLRSILTSLLLQTPTELAPSQLTPDLLMRRRMLGTNPPPHVYDSSETFSSTSALISDADRLASQRAFVSSISRPPIELSVTSADVDLTAHNLFHHRIKAHLVAEEGEQDPIELFEYDTFCCDAWHAQRRLLVGFPRVEDFEEVKLYMMLVGDEEGVMRLDNLFSVRKGEEVRMVEEGLHRWPERCTERGGVGRRGEQVREGEAEGEDQGAEYINDADDFWAGFSDEEDADGRDMVQRSAPELRVEGNGRDIVWVSAPVLRAGRVEQEREETEQEKAIKDIVRGAYTLHRSIRGSGQDSMEDFMRLVRSAITTTSRP